MQKRESFVAGVAALFVLLAGMPALAQELAPIERDVAKRVAEQLCQKAAKFKKAPVTIRPEVDKANGIRAGHEAAVLVVPQKGLRERPEGEQEPPELNSKTGAALGLLFCYHLTPLVKDVPTDVSRLRKVTYTDPDGDSAEVWCLLLTVRRLAKDDYRLYVYGTGEKPLVEAKFTDGTGPGIKPVAVQIKDVQGDQGWLVVTVFDKYQAKFQLAYQP